MHGAGGYGMLVGPASSREQIEHFRQLLIAKPDGYHRARRWPCPTARPSSRRHRAAPSRFAPFVLSSGECVNMVPGGLTRVALTKGSLVVNSSQGGGTKDTWVLED